MAAVSSSQVGDAQSRLRLLFFGFVALGALEPKFFRAFCEAVGRPELADRQFDRNADGTEEPVEEVAAVAVMLTLLAGRPGTDGRELAVGLVAFLAIGLLWATAVLAVRRASRA